MVITDLHRNRIEFSILQYYIIMLPVMAAVAVRKKVVSIDHFSPSFCFQSLQIFLLVRSNQKHLHVLVALFIREM